MHRLKRGVREYKVAGIHYWLPRQAIPESAMQRFEAYLSVRSRRRMNRSRNKPKAARFIHGGDEEIAQYCVCPVDVPDCVHFAHMQSLLCFAAVLVFRKCAVLTAFFCVSPVRMSTDRT